MLGDDGLPLDEVGSWAKEKHERLRKFIDISRATRRKWVQGPGGATYIDLYCGTGKATIRDSGENIDGSPLVAFKCARSGGVPFSEIHIADASGESCRAADLRLRSLGALPFTETGPASEDRAANNQATEPLRTALRFSRSVQSPGPSLFSKYIDLLIHVSAQDLQRNFAAYTKSADSPLDAFAPGWRRSVDLGRSPPAIRAAFFAYWAASIEALGLPPAKRAELVSGTTKNQRLYWLVFVSRSDFAKRLWDKIRSLSGQRDLL
jgi:hypothetical protein